LAYYNDKGQHGDITNEDVSKALKEVATVLNYPTAKGIPNGRIDTHLLQRGGANALSLSGYSDTQKKKKKKKKKIKDCGEALRSRIHPRRAVCGGMSKSIRLRQYHRQRIQHQLTT
jgi:hypothetical protein